MALKKTILISLTICISILTCGCAPKLYNMTPSYFKMDKQHPYTVSINIKQDPQARSFADSIVTKKIFKRALRDSILKSRLFSNVKSRTADYALEVTISRFDQPTISFGAIDMAFGLDLTVSVETKWRLTKTGLKNKEITTETIQNSYKATLADAILANERLRKANEGAVRENIQEGINRLSRLDLKK